MNFYSGVSNYRETPYIISDTFANKVNYSAAIVGAIYICRDGSSLSEPSIYQANGTVWVAIGSYGIGTDATLEDVTTNGNTTDNGITITAGGLSTNTLTVTGLTPKSVPFVGTADLLTEDNTNFVWDNVNKRLGINTNTPGNSLDVHSAGSNSILALNNTAGNQTAISFLNNTVLKWIIGNSSTNLFNIYNQLLALNAISIDSTNIVTFGRDISLKENTLIQVLPGFASIAFPLPDVLSFNVGSSIKSFSFYLANLTAGRQYTLPNASGTLALTSDLSAYLPLTAGTLTGILTISNSSSTLYAPLSEASRFPTASQIYLTNSNAANNSFSGISLQVTRTSGGNSNAYIGAVSSATNPEIVFGQRDGTNDLYIERLRITNAGNVGIGTNAPIGNFDVASLNPSLYIRNLTNVGVTLGQTNGELDFYSDDASGIGPHILSSIKSVHDGSSLLAPAGALTFSTAIQGVAQIEAMRISSSGNLLIGLTIDTTLAKLQIAGNLQLTATGNKLLINATVNTAAAGASTAGSTTLIAGTIVVSTTAVTANSIILITAQSGTITGSLKISARSAGTSFTILSTVLTDTPLVGWLIIN